VSDQIPGRLGPVISDEGAQKNGNQLAVVAFLSRSKGPKAYRIGSRRWHPDRLKGASLRFRLREPENAHFREGNRREPSAINSLDREWPKEE